MEIYKQPPNYIGKYHSLLYVNDKIYMSVQTDSESTIIVLEGTNLNNLNEAHPIFEKTLNHAVGTNTVLLINNGKLSIIGGDGVARKKSFGLYLYTFPINKTVENYKLILPVNIREPYEKPLSSWVDSQPSIVFKDGLYYLYYRLNTKKGIRRLRVTTSRDFRKFTNNQYKMINTKDSVYYAFIFLYQNLFYGFLLTYNCSDIYNVNKIVMVKSVDGFNFETVSDDLFKGQSQIYPVNGMISLKNETFVFFYHFKTRSLKRYSFQDILDPFKS